MALLIVTEGWLRGQRFPLEDEAVIGRADDSTIQVTDLMITRHHCRLRRTPEGYTIEDLGSRNGTFVNEKAAQGAVLLKDGDLIRVHTSIFRYFADVVVDREQPSSTTVTMLDASPSSVSDSISIEGAGVDGHAARASDSAEALDRAHRRLQIVVEVGNAVRAHAKLDNLLREVMDSFFRVFPQMDRGFVMIRHPGSSTMEVRLALQRGRATAQTIAVSRHIIGEACRKRVGILSADAMEDSRFSEAGSVVSNRIRSMMCAPLTAADEILGVIHVDTFHEDRRFTHEDLELFTAVANQIALAISYTRIKENLRDRQRMEHELAMARQVQHSFLPAGPPKLEGYDFSAAYRAAREVGGDFYDFISIPDGRLGIVVGDVMGKGMPAALMMVRIMSDIRFIATGEREPAAILDRLNAGFTQRDGDTSFVTMLFMVLDPAARKLTIANAGHWPPLLRKGATGPFNAVSMEDVGFAVGAVAEAKYRQYDIPLGAGDCLLAFTDGVTEAEGAGGKYFGSQRLAECLNLPEARPEALVQKVLAEVQSFCGPRAQSDDLTILCLGVRPGPAQSFGTPTVTAPAAPAGTAPVA
jgi:serine phosphatase RsbU (regulator of sigma subunit)